MRKSLFIRTRASHKIYFYFLIIASVICILEHPSGD